jgi:drug/metabolite transporter (DMT)-like permease
MVMALSPMLFKEKLTWNKLAAMAAVVAGMVCITGVAGSRRAAPGAAYCARAVAAVLYATLIVSNKSIKHVSGLHSTLSELVIGFFVILVSLALSAIFPFAVPSGGSSSMC